MIFNGFERMMAFRYLRPRRKEGFVSVIAGFSFLAICLGVATLVIVMAVMNGFRHDLLGRILGLNGHIVVSASSPIENYEEVAERLQDVPGITAVHPTLSGHVLALARGVSGGAQLRGLRPEDLARRPTLSENIVQGTLEDFDHGDAAMIGAGMAQKYGLSLGDKITLIAPQGDPAVFGTAPRVRVYRVAAIFRVGMYAYDGGYVYVPLKTAQAYFNAGDAVDQIEILTRQPDAVGPVMDSVRQRLGGDFVLTDWTRLNASLFNALQVERDVMFLILTMIILIAAFNIVSGLVMLVKDKGSDIAILRTMGAGKNEILRIFFLTGASIGVAGTVSGLFLGLLFCSQIGALRTLLQRLGQDRTFAAEIRFLSEMPVLVDPKDVVLAGIIALGLSLAATLYPSWRAARIDPVEALRYE